MCFLLFIVGCGIDWVVAATVGAEASQLHDKMLLLSCEDGG